MSTLRVNNIAVTSGTPATATTNLTTIGNRDDAVYAQFNRLTGYSTAAGQNKIPLDNTYIAKNISLNPSTSEITFVYPGVYRIDVGFRFGTGSDVWNGVNMATAAGTQINASFGTGQIANDAGPAMFSFLVNITNVSVNYIIRMYRNSSGNTVATPDTSAGSATVVTIARVD